MIDQAEDCRRLLAAIKAELGFPGVKDLPQEPRGYPNALALCIIDSIQSLRNNYYKTVRPVVIRYVEYRANSKGDANRDGVREFLDALEQMGGVSRWSTDVGTLHKAPGTRVLKGEAMKRAAEALERIDILTTDDLRRAALDPDELAKARRAWTGVHGLGKASWDYLLMLAGTDGSKADTLLRRFVTRALQLDKVVEPNRAQNALKCAARELEVTEKRLDHAIWLKESGNAK